jgi:hypothetical protein
MSHTANSELTEPFVDPRPGHPRSDEKSDPFERDEKGRIKPNQLTDRELLIEVVTSQRATQDLVESFIASMSKNPMLKMMAGKLM